MKKSYYEILEVSQNASPEIIEKAYKTLTRKHHPDVQTKENVKESEIRFKEIVKAYKTLSDPEKRSEYDELQTLKEEVKTLKKEKATDDSTEQNSKNVASYFKAYAHSIGTSVYNHTKKSDEDRSKDIKALAIALVFMVVIGLLFWKVPVLRNFLFR